jgi:hypothetical protein
MRVSLGARAPKVLNTVSVSDHVQFARILT